MSGFQALKNIVEAGNAGQPVNPADIAALKADAHIINSIRSGDFVNTVQSSGDISTFDNDSIDVLNTMATASHYIATPPNMLLKGKKFTKGFQKSLGGLPQSHPDLTAIITEQASNARRDAKPARDAAAQAKKSKWIPRWRKPVGTSYGSAKKNPLVQTASFVVGGVGKAWGKIPIVSGATFIALNAPIYIRRGISWRYTHKSYTDPLFNKFNSLKRESATNHLINIDARMAEEHGATGNFVFREADGTPKYDMRGSLESLGTILSQRDIQDASNNYVASLTASQSKLSAIGTILESSKEADTFSQLIGRQINNVNQEATRVINSKVSDHNEAIAAMEAANTKIQEAASNAIALISDPAQISSIQAQATKFETLATDFVATAKKVPKGTQKHIGLANTLQDFSSALQQQQQEFDTNVIQPIVEKAEETLKAQMSAFETASNDSTKGVESLSDSLKRLDENVTRLEENIDIIHAAPNPGKYSGGTVVARLAAYKSEPTVAKLRAFSDKVARDSAATVGSLGTQKTLMLEKFEALQNALKSDNRDLAIRRIAETSHAISQQIHSAGAITTPANPAMLAEQAALMRDIDAMVEGIKPYTYNTDIEFGSHSPKYWTPKEHGQRRVKGERRMGMDLWGSPTKFAITQNVGVVDAPVHDRMSRRQRAFRREFAALYKDGKISIPSDRNGKKLSLKALLKHAPWEDTRTRNKRTNAGKFDRQKFLEQAWRGQTGTEANTSVGNQKITEHTTTMLNNGEDTLLIESYKWLATSYADGKDFKELNDKIDRTLGIRKDLIDVLDKKKKDLQQSGQKDPFTDEKIALLKHMQSAPVGLGANNWRRNWKKAWLDTLPFRYNGDYANEFWDTSSSEYGVRGWFFKRRWGAHKVWPVKTTVSTLWDHSGGKKYIGPVIDFPFKKYPKVGMVVTPFLKGAALIAAPFVIYSAVSGAAKISYGAVFDGNDAQIERVETTPEFIESLDELPTIVVPEAESPQRSGTTDGAATRPAQTQSTPRQTTGGTSEAFRQSLDTLPPITSTPEPTTEDPNAESDFVKSLDELPPLVAPD